jgi:hypothetical protein
MAPVTGAVLITLFLRHDVCSFLSSPF